jgi:hypothetical protein
VHVIFKKTGKKNTLRVRAAHSAFPVRLHQSKDAGSEVCQDLSYQPS